MRASKTVDSQPESIDDRGSKNNEIHISGAEGICGQSDIVKISNDYIKRALSHSRGEPDKIVITIEKIKKRPKRISLLPVKTVRCNIPDEARKTAVRKLTEIGISKKAINTAFKILTSPGTMRGASLVLSGSGSRAEPDGSRGVRVSRLGIEKNAAGRLSRRLSRSKINTPTVKEALILASKVASCPEIIAEVCISDDPDYTTGYIASKESGYLRITNIKSPGDMHGGRVFFINENADIEKIINYLEKKPVIIYF